jgi:hypothetical protein
MMRRMLDTIGVVLPLGALILLAVVFGLFEGLYWIGRVWIALLGGAWEDRTDGLGLGPVGFSYLAYGVWRGLGFHPVFWPKYREWLTTVPWEPSKRLPMGPIHLVWQDAVVLTVAATPVLWHASTLNDAIFTVSAALCGFAASYTLIQAVALLSLGQDVLASILFAGVGLAAFLFPRVLASASVLLACCAIAAIGIWASIRRFPWQHIRDLSLFSVGRGDQVGWPFGDLAPCQPPARQNYFRTSFLCSLVMSWWIIAVLWKPGVLLWPPADYRLLSVVILASVSVSAFTILAYFDGTRWPMSPFGRLATRSFILPGFDQVFVGPLCAVAATAAIWVACVEIRLSSLFAAAGCVASFVLILGTVGPTIQRWRTTGAVRLTAPGDVVKTCEQI